MSSIKRIVSSTSSGILSNISNFFFQIISVPIFLTYWPLELYASWIIVLSLSIFASLPVFSYEEYCSQEFLKLGKKNKNEISKIVFGSATINFVYVIFLIFLFYFLSNKNYFILFFKIDSKLIEDTIIAFLIYFSIYIFSSINAIFIRCLYPFNYYPKIQWIGFFITFLVSILQIFFVMHGVKLIGLAVVTCIIYNLHNVLLLIYLIFIFKKEKIIFKKFYFKSNFKHFCNSFYLLIGNFLDFFRSQGIRLILGTKVGANQLVGYTTTRTASNFIVSFYNSIAEILKIELIGFINKNDRKSFNNLLVYIFFIFCFIISPCIYLIQFIAPELFRIWTNDKILYDPILFASLCMSTLLIIFYRPANIIIKGKNLFKIDLKISLISIASLILLLLYFIETYKIRGIGYSLIIFEFVICTYNFYYAQKWLKENFFLIKKNLLLIGLLDLIFTFISIFVFLKFGNFISLIFFGSSKIFIFILFLKTYRMYSFKNLKIS